MRLATAPKLWLPPLGAAAGTGLLLYFTGAFLTVLRARCYPHLAAPLPYLAPVAGSWRCGPPPEHRRRRVTSGAGRLSERRPARAGPVSG
ncbi:DoxX family protein [Streptomyces sp. YIM 98790]|uniref:DoxX family protein n=1 Tax=Streptomyces sp. YIM 98790 TaxID=2689077 RepID=UPI0037DC231F